MLNLKFHFKMHTKDTYCMFNIFNISNSSFDFSFNKHLFNISELIDHEWVNLIPRMFFFSFLKILNQICKTIAEH